MDTDIIKDLKGVIQTLKLVADPTAGVFFRFAPESIDILNRVVAFLQQSDTKGLDEKKWFCMRNDFKLMVPGTHEFRARTRILKKDACSYYGAMTTKKICERYWKKSRFTVFSVDFTKRSENG